MFDEALASIQMALSKDPNSDQFLKQQKTIKAKKQAVSRASAAARAPKQMSESQKKEFAELQEATNGYMR